MKLDGYDVVDLRRPNEGWLAIGVVDGIAIHHTVSDFDHDASNDLDAVNAILRYHTETLGWPGIGYHMLIGDDGTIYYVGDLGLQRAHVKNENNHLWGIGLLGSYMTDLPPPAQVDGAARAIKALRVHRGEEVVWKGHKEWRADTACPGDNWPTYGRDIEKALKPAPSPNLCVWREVQRSLAHEVTGPVPGAALRRTFDRLKSLYEPTT